IHLPRAGLRGRLDTTPPRDPTEPEHHCVPAEVEPLEAEGQDLGWTPARADPDDVEVPVFGRGRRKEPPHLLGRQRIGVDAQPSTRNGDRRACQAVRYDATPTPAAMAVG